MLGVVQSPRHGAQGGEVAVVEEVVEFHAEDVELQVRLDDFRALENDASSESRWRQKKTTTTTTINK